MTTHKLGFSQEDFEELKKRLSPPVEEEEVVVHVSVTSTKSESTLVDSVDQPKDVHLDIHHLDVGQGESTLITLMYERECLLAILIDGGLQRDGGGMLIRLMHQLGIQNLDAVLVSHFDRDHYEGLIRVLDHHGTFYRLKKEGGEDGEYEGGILEKSFLLEHDLSTSDQYVHLPSFEGTDKESWKPINVFNVFVRDDLATVAEAKKVKRPDPPKKGGKAKKNPVLIEFQDAVTRSNAHLHYIQEGDELVLDCNADTAAGKKQFKMTCLCVNRGGEGSSEDDENAHSAGWLLEFGQYTYYTAGDLPSADGEHELEDSVATALAAKLGNKPITAVKCGHHGSRTSTSATFLDTLKPPLVFISSGKQDGFGHPHPDVLVRLYQATSVRALFVTNCAYSRPLINKDYATHAYQGMYRSAREGLSALELLRDRIQVQGGDVGVKSYESAYPERLLVLRQALQDEVITPLSGLLDTLGATTAAEVEDSSLLALRTHLTAFEDWLKGKESGQMRAALNTGFKIQRAGDTKSVRGDLHSAEALKLVKEPLGDACTMAEELRSARAALKTEREQTLFLLVSGTETTMGNNVFRMYLADAHLDGRAAFVGAACSGSWKWFACTFGGLDPSLVPLPTDDYFSMVESKRQHHLKPPDSPGTFSGYVEERSELKKRRRSLVTDPTEFPTDLLELITEDDEEAEGEKQKEKVETGDVVKKKKTSHVLSTETLNIDFPPFDPSGGGLGGPPGGTPGGTSGGTPGGTSVPFKPFGTHVF